LIGAARMMIGFAMTLASGENTTLASAAVWMKNGTLAGSSNLTIGAEFAGFPASTAATLSASIWFAQSDAPDGVRWS